MPNVIIDGEEVAALIDFEDARLDQPEADLDWWTEYCRFHLSITGRLR